MGRRTPIHLLGWGVDLDRRSPGVAGAARAPHAMVQELLNRTDEHLWARPVQRPHPAAAARLHHAHRPAYVEFDLEAMFDGELFADFALLYLLAHQSRVEVADGAAPSDVLAGALAHHRHRARASARWTLLRDGVETAIETLGTGFLQHPANAALRQSPRGRHRPARRRPRRAAAARLPAAVLVRRRGPRRAARPRTPTADQRARYRDYFSSARLRDLALRRRGSGHDDLWQAATLVLDALGRSGRRAPTSACPASAACSSATAARRARRLAGSPNDRAAGGDPVPVGRAAQGRAAADGRLPQPRRRGARLVYESLLELVPRYDPVSHAFSLETLAGNERKTTGSYYTPLRADRAPPRHRPRPGARRRREAHPDPEERRGPARR